MKKQIVFTHKEYRQLYITMGKVFADHIRRDKPKPPYNRLDDWCIGVASLARDEIEKEVK